MIFDKQSVEQNLPPIPVSVRGENAIGEIILGGNNPFIVVRHNGELLEARFPWSSILQSLNEDNCRLPIDKSDRAPVVPRSEFSARWFAMPVAERAAVAEYIRENGRNWRSKLRGAWMAGDDILRYTRNAIGPNDLDKIANNLK